MSEAGDMAAFSASEVACYKWPGDTEIDRARRAAFCEGAAYEAEARIERQQTGELPTLARR